MLGATTSGDPLRYRVGTPWDFRSRFELHSFEAWPEAAGQPMVRWRAEVVERASESVEPAAAEEAAELASSTPIAIEGHVEIRWTHGRFSGAPEAKVHLDTHPHDVPGYFPIT